MKTSADKTEIRAIMNLEGIYADCAGMTSSWKMKEKRNRENRMVI